MGGAVVQAMAQPGVDVRLVLHQHERLGSVMVMGAGGVAGRTDSQLPVAVLPLTDADATDLVRRSSVGAMFDEQQTDTTPLEQLVLRLSQLAVNVPEIRELVLDPVIVVDGRAAVTDASARVAPVAVDPQPAVRRLS